MVACRMPWRQWVTDTDMSVWTTTDVSHEFSIEGFATPFLIVKRKSDGVRGTVEWTGNPKVYFDFREGVRHVPQCQPATD